MESRRRIVALLATAAIAISACSSGTVPSPSPVPATPAASASAPTGTVAPSAAPTLNGAGIKIQVIQPGVHPYPASENKGLQAEAAKLGVDLQIATGDWNPETDNANIQNAITKGVQAIIIQPNSSEAVAPAIDAANAAGICTIALLTNPGGSVDTVYKGMKAYIGWNEYEAGQLAGESLAKAMGGKGNVVIIEGALASSASVAREKGAVDLWTQKYPDIKVLAKQPGDYDAEKARNIMTDFVQRFGSQINGALVITNNMATAAADVVAATPELAGKVPITSYGGQGQFIDYIKAGKTYSTTPFAPYDEGVAAVDLAVQCANGDKTAVFLDERELPAVKPLASAGFLVNPDNVNQFTPQW
jgi:ribose transport system substrate-binding protein